VAISAGDCSFKGFGTAAPAQTWKKCEAMMDAGTATTRQKAGGDGEQRRIVIVAIPLIWIMFPFVQDSRGDFPIQACGRPWSGGTTAGIIKSSSSQPLSLDSIGL